MIVNVIYVRDGDDLLLLGQVDERVYPRSRCPLG